MCKKIACYLSSHGYGHAVRSETVIAAMALKKPDWIFFIISGSPEFLFKRALQLPNVHFRNKATDFGLVQTNPRVIDLNSTANQLEELVSDYAPLVEREEAFLSRESISAIFCDIPFLPFLAAQKLAIPSAGMGNFTWDWIYYYYKQQNPIFETAARLAYRCYTHCDLYLALPSSPKPSAFKTVENIPLVCRKPALSADILRQELQIPSKNKIILIAFSDITLSEKALKKIERIADTTFLIPDPLQLQLKNGIHIPTDMTSFHNLVALADTIITKPGYGIISDAIASRIPLVTTERGDFPEVPYLDALLQQTVSQTKLSMKQFEAGKWKHAIRKASLPNFTFDINGTEIASKRLLQFFSLHTLP